MASSPKLFACVVTTHSEYHFNHCIHRKMLFGRTTLAFLLHVLLLSGISRQTCRADEIQTSKLSDGVYTLQLASTNCFLSYQNRKCADNHPVVRPKTTLWKRWSVRVLDKEQGIVTLKTSVDYGRCPNGTLSRSAEDWCQVPPYATEVSVVAQGPSPPLEHELFKLVPVDASTKDGLYYVIAAGKPSNCARYLGATGCTSGSVRTKLAVEGEEGVLTVWGFSKVEGSPPLPSPIPPSVAPKPAPAPSSAPAQAPTPTVSPPQPIPGPIIEPSMYGQSIMTSGFFEISLKSLGGNSVCSASYITFTTVNTMTKETTSTAAYSAEIVKSVPVTIPLPFGYTYDVYAVGICTNGGTTERSNILSVSSVDGRRREAPVITTTNMGSTSADISWDAGALDGSFQYQVIAVTSGGSCTDTPVATSTVASSTLTAQLINMGLNTPYEVFVKAVSTTDPSYFVCSAGQRVRTWPYAFLPRYANPCTTCNALIRCSFENNLMQTCINVGVGSQSFPRASAVAPMEVSSLPKILIGGSNVAGGYPALYRCDLNSDLDAVSNCVTSDVSGTTSVNNRVGGILVYNNMQKVLLTESDGDNKVYACDLDMTAAGTVADPLLSGCAATASALNGQKPDGIARKGNTVFISSRLASPNGGIWQCTFDPSASNANALTSCTKGFSSSDAFDLYYDPVSDILWGTREFESNAAALVSCPGANLAQCQDGIVSSVTGVAIGAKGIASSRGYTFWAGGTNVYTGVVNSGDSKVSSYRTTTVAAINNADEIKWYPAL